MDFDVIIPAFNDEATIATAVRSVLGQELLASVIVVDDGSSDGTADAVRAIGDDRVRVLQQANAGPGAARNTGAAHAGASHLVFLDADDRLLPDALLTFAAGNRGRRLIRSGAVIRYPGDVDSIVIAVDDDHRFPRGSPLAGSFAIDRELFHHIGGYDPEFRFGENSELLFRAQDELFSRGGRAAFVGGATVLCFRQEERASDHYRAHRIRAAERMIEKFGHLLVNDRETLHNHHAIASELYRQEGRIPEAKRHAAAAIRSRPLAPRSWARLVRLSLVDGRRRTA